MVIGKSKCCAFGDLSELGLYLYKVGKVLISHCLTTLIFMITLTNRIKDAIQMRIQQQQNINWKMMQMPLPLSYVSVVML